MTLLDSYLRLSQENELVKNFVTGDSRDGTFQVVLKPSLLSYIEDSMPPKEELVDGAYDQTIVEIFNKVKAGADYMASYGYNARLTLSDVGVARIEVYFIDGGDGAITEGLYSELDIETFLKKAFESVAEYTGARKRALKQIESAWGILSSELPNDISGQVQHSRELVMRSLRAVRDIELQDLFDCRDK